MDQKTISIKSSQRIILNVGGVSFETTFETLQKSKFLVKLIEWELQKEEIDLGQRFELFVDQDPDRFKIVLSYMRNPLQEIDFETYKLDFNFYMVDYPKESSKVEYLDSYECFPKISKMTEARKKIISLQIAKLLWPYFKPKPKNKYNSSEVYEESFSVPGSVKSFLELTTIIYKYWGCQYTPDDFLKSLFEKFGFGFTADPKSFWLMKIEETWFNNNYFIKEEDLQQILDIYEKFFSFEFDKENLGSDKRF